MFLAQKCSVTTCLEYGRTPALPQVTTCLTRGCEHLPFPLRNNLPPTLPPACLPVQQGGTITPWYSSNRMITARPPHLPATRKLKTDVTEARPARNALNWRPRRKRVNTQRASEGAKESGHLSPLQARRRATMTLTRTIEDYVKITRAGITVRKPWNGTAPPLAFCKRS